MDGPLRGQVLPLRRVGQELLMHRFGRDPGERQRGLKFWIGLAFRLHNRVNLRHQRRILRFALWPAAAREIVKATNAGAQLVQPGMHRVSPPAKNTFCFTGTPLTIPNRHFRLELPPLKPSQLPRTRLNRLPYRFGQIAQHGPFPETVTSPTFLWTGLNTRIAQLRVDHFPLDA